MRLMAGAGQVSYSCCGSTMKKDVILSLPPAIQTDGFSFTELDVGFNCHTSHALHTPTGWEGNLLPSLLGRRACQQLTPYRRAIEQCSAAHLRSRAGGRTRPHSIRGVSLSTSSQGITRENLRQYRAYAREGSNRHSDSVDAHPPRADMRTPAAASSTRSRLNASAGLHLRVLRYSSRTFAVHVG